MTAVIYKNGGGGIQKMRTAAEHHIIIAEKAIRDGYKGIALTMYGVLSILYVKEDAQTEIIEKCLDEIREFLTK